MNWLKFSWISLLVIFFAGVSTQSSPSNYTDLRMDLETCPKCCHLDKNVDIPQKNINNLLAKYFIKLFNPYRYNPHRYIHTDTDDVNNFLNIMDCFFFFFLTETVILYQTH